MTYHFHVRSHPLGVVVFSDPGKRGELLLPGETCCGVLYEELERIASTTQRVEVDVSAAHDCPLLRNKRQAA